MSVKVKVKSMNPRGINLYSTSFKKKFMVALNISGNDVRNSAIELINSGVKSGRRYGKHQASAPGQAPATDTGVLRNNIVVSSNAEKLEVEVASRAKYSKFLEFGTVKMKARPFMFPAFEMNKPKIRRRFAKVKGRAK